MEDYKRSLNQLFLVVIYASLNHKHGYHFVGYCYDCFAGAIFLFDSFEVSHSSVALSRGLAALTMNPTCPLAALAYAPLDPTTNMLPTHGAIKLNYVDCILVLSSSPRGRRTKNTPYL
ncbi:MAG TPA: hypothetical protein VK503_08240 [Candidatus Bathyarchaeia archaeon]|nr:hypothetical protein [Candidatus Bathyarchaeia archaeon]